MPRAYTFGNAKGRVELQIESKGEPRWRLPAACAFHSKHREGFVVLSSAGFKRPGSWETLRALFEAPYREGFRIETPNDGARSRRTIQSLSCSTLASTGTARLRAVPMARRLGRVTSGRALRLAQWSTGSSRRHAPPSTTICIGTRIANPRGFKVTEDASRAARRRVWPG